MVLSATTGKNLWDNFYLEDSDIEFIYNILLEKETPLPLSELLDALIANRINKEKEIILNKNLGEGKIYLPKDSFQVGEELIFPAFTWKKGKVIDIRDGFNPELTTFKVIKVEFEDGSIKEMACELISHNLNINTDAIAYDPALDKEKVLAKHREEFLDQISIALAKHKDFVQIADNWFPRALLVDINHGYLNLIEAILEENNGGPMATRELMEQIDFNPLENQKLAEFSLNWALQSDDRFDEVGPSGEVLWCLRSLEPADVQKKPPFLEYKGTLVSDKEVINSLSLFEGAIADELEQNEPKGESAKVTISLIFPHWRAGTLPLSNSLINIFPTALESPRVRFTFRDEDTDEMFNGWVVRQDRYVAGLGDWYKKKGIIPGSLISVKKSALAGEVLIRCERSRQNKEWLKTVLVGSDKGIVFAMLKHPIEVGFNERMALVIPDVDALDRVWKEREKIDAEKIFMQIVHELAKLNPQGHIHAQELYAAVNVVFRCPPSSVLFFLLNNPAFQHLGDLYFHLQESQ